MRWLFVVSVLLLAACDNDGNFVFSERRPVVKPLNEVNEKMAFDCVYEKFPEVPKEADVLFHYARWLQKNNQLKREETVDAEIERLYRVAAEHGHYKANINLQNGAMRGRFKFRAHEYLRFSQQLIDAQVATGYYFIAIFLNQGAAGLEKDPEMALRYFRKAADEGSALAQYHVGEKLEPIAMAPDTAFRMFRCAAEQGHGEAAVALGIHHQLEKQYEEAINVLQLGVAAGDEIAAHILEKGFWDAPSSGKFDYLGQEKDRERAERYKKIGVVLGNYSYANPVVPEINDIVPLPPAKLPPWDGKLQWLEARVANIPPEKPSEALIFKLAKEKVLDPLTGKPMPGSPAFSKAENPIMVCQSGDLCPESGYWQVLINSWTDYIHYFEKGALMPLHSMTWTEPRLWPLRDKVMQREEPVEWALLG